MLFARVKIESDNAELIHKALKPDDMNWCYTYAKDGILFIEVKTEKMGAMINALEDYFINLKALQSVIKALNELKL
jgi:tRNA threonylcarbamoyladenosine modification (KEOPS) complex  Pcc1 subunit